MWNSIILMWWWNKIRLYPYKELLPSAKITPTMSPPSHSSFSKFTAYKFANCIPITMFDTVEIVSIPSHSADS